MTLSVANCADLVRLTLRGDPPVETSLQFLVNSAGRHLCSMHRWRFLARPAASIDTVAGQDYLGLPADFSEIMGMDGSATGTNTIEPVTLEFLNELRRSGTSTANGGRYYALAYAAQSGSTPPTPRLEVWPVPSSTETGVYNLMYRAGWTDVALDTDFIPVPPWAEALYSRILQAFARGFDDEDTGSIDARLTEIRAGQLFMAACSEDRMKQPNHGGLTPQTMIEPSGRMSWPFVITGP
jgi:hypothetical protein